MRQHIRSQTFVFFAVSLGAIFLLCGLGLDLGLWFLDRTRLVRACDSAAITGAANFGKTETNNPEAGRVTVANKMREVAVANFYGLRNIAAASTNPTRYLTTNSSGGTNYNYYYMNAKTNEAGYHVTIATGLLGQVTLARSEAWTKTRTVFMGFSGIQSLMQLNTFASSESKRRPRMIVLVIDRSDSMTSNTGSANMESAVTNFLGLMKNDYANNTVGIVSFSCFGRVEMLPTTNFWNEGTAKLYKCTVTSTNTTGLKFGGNTGADEGMRLALEIMRTNAGWTDPQTYKFIVFFTDGRFNMFRTMMAAPTWTNTLQMPTGVTPDNTSFGSTTLPYSDFWPNTGNAFAYAMGTALDPGQTRQSNSIISGSSPPAKYRAFLWPGWMLYTKRASGTVETNWSTSVTSVRTNQLAAGDSLSLVAPGYVLDANLSPDSTSASGPSSNPGYISGCGYHAYKATDGGEPYGYVYPDGIYLSYANITGSYTNLYSSGGPDGELFYDQYGGVMREMTTATEWARYLPSFATNYVYNTTNITTPGGSMRYYAIDYRGLAKPTSWIGDGGTNLPWNAIPGGWTNKGTPYSTNINSMSLNGAPTHYYDFRIGGWSNFSSWVMADSAFSQPICEWKVLSYCNMARQSEVIVYAVGFAKANTNIMRAMANDRNATNYNPSLPTGNAYYCSSGADIVSKFTQIAQQILAFLSK